METNTRPPQPSQLRRAWVEIIDGQLRVFPVANSDREAEEILSSFWNAVDQR